MQDVFRDTVYLCIYDCFVIWQPEAGKFLDFDHVTFWVGNAKQVSSVKNAYLVYYYSYIT